MGELGVSQGSEEGVRVLLGRPSVSPRLQPYHHA